MEARGETDPAMRTAAVAVALSIVGGACEQGWPAGSDPQTALPSPYSAPVAPSFEYDEHSWAASAGHRPLEGVDVNQVFLLHRHWIWANLQRARFEETLGQAPKPDDGAFLADVAWASMYMWYGLLWSVIEAFEERHIEIRGPMSADIDYVSDTLRRCRNVVFHVSSKNQHDVRLYELMGLPDSAAAIMRISTGFGRMFIEESEARKLSGEIPTA